MDGAYRGTEGKVLDRSRLRCSCQPKLQIEGDERGKGHWIVPNRQVSKGHRTCLWRFDARIPYLYPLARPRQEW